LTGISVPDWFYGRPTLEVMLTTVLVSVLGTWVGAVFLRPVLKLFALRQADWNGLVSAVLSCFGIFYGLLLGLLAVAAYQNYAQIEDLVSNEALALGGLYQEIQDVYPEPVALQLQADLKEYLRTTIEDDWPRQQRGEIPQAGTAALRTFLKRLRAYEPLSDTESIWHQSVIGSVEKTRELRRGRLYSVQTGLPGTMWCVVLLGAVINIMFVYLFDLRLMNVLLLGGILSFFIATVIGLIITMDRPLRGPSGISPAPFVTVHNLVMSGDDMSIPANVP
jgi:hypothetical protein